LIDFSGIVCTYFILYFVNNIVRKYNANQNCYDKCISSIEKSRKKCFDWFAGFLWRIRCSKNLTYGDSWLLPFSFGFITNTILFLCAANLIFSYIMQVKKGE